MTAAFHSLPAYDVTAIQAGLRTAAIGRIIHYQASMASTNSAAIALAQEGSCHGTLVLADAQRAGRGRRGRQWYSPPGRNLYCSVIFRMPPGQTGSLTLIPLASALAVADVISDSAAIPCRLKWPNDVLIRDKKVAGILCESVGGQADTIVVIGIGINVNSQPEDLPGELKSTATTLLAERGVPRDIPIDRTALVSTLMNRLEERMALLSPQTQPRLLDAYRTRCATLGQWIHATVSETDMIEGIAEAIGVDGSLHIRRSSSAGSGRTGELVEVRSADILHLRRMTGTGSMG
jgi:BirA family biotin operon repressor/biotin-[acetyl-CoA-carboxylase] ligase